jgi:hypothetical protein
VCEVRRLVIARQLADTLRDAFESLRPYHQTVESRPSSSSTGVV